MSTGITETTIRAFRRKSKTRSKPSPIKVFDISDEELEARITENLMFTDFAYARKHEFVPTSKRMPPTRNWGGKYRCMHCTCTGYFWRNTTHLLWWGINHGENCSKRP